jgi:hypothetical protein
MKTFLTLRTAMSVALSLLWLLSITFGLRQVWRYDNSPGKAGVAPAHWPKNPLLNYAANGASLVMVVHPQCPCSRASLAELAQLMARSQGRLSATVIFVRYAGVSEHWVQTDLWRQATAIPGVRVVSDPDGTLSRQFGALTSGQTYLYDGQGRRLFSGGLTASRGHEGDSEGLNAALALVRGQTPVRTNTPIFGCPLFPKTTPMERRQPCRL